MATMKIELNKKDITEAIREWAMKRFVNLGIPDRVSIQITPDHRNGPDSWAGSVTLRAPEDES